MSLMGMKQHIQKFAIPVSVGIAGIMLAGTFAGMGRNSTSTSLREAAKAETTVAKIGNLAVTQRMLDRIVDQQVQQFAMFGMPKPPAEALDNYRLRALDAIKSQQALIASAQKAGITLSDDEIKKGIDEVWEKQLRPQVTKTLSLPETATDKEVDAALAKSGNGATVELLKQQYIDPEAVKIKLYNDKLTKQVADKLTLDSYKVRHILVKWDGKTTTEAAAKAKAEKLLAEVKATPTKFGDIAKASSDDPGSKDKGGLYEWLKDDLKTLVPEFKAAVEKLKPGETTTELVRHADPKSYNGFHIIHLDEISKASDEKREKAAQGELTKLVDAAAPGIKQEILAPGLQAAQYVQDASKDPKKIDEKLLGQALAELEKIKPEEDSAGTTPLRKAVIFEQLKQSDKAIAAYQEAIKASGDKVTTRNKIATLLLEKGDKAGALAQLTEAEKLAPPEPDIWFQIGQLYSKAGDKAGMTRAILKNQELTKRQQQQLAAQAAAAAQANKKPGEIQLPGEDKKK